MVSNIEENATRFFLSTSGPRVRGSKQNETDNPERLRILWANSKYKNKAQLVLTTKGPTALKGRQLEVMIRELGVGGEGVPGQLARELCKGVSDGGAMKCH